MTVLNIVLPIFLVIGLGAALRRTGFLTAEHTASFNRLVFMVAAPALLLHSAAATPLDESLDPRVLLVFVIVSAGLAAIVLLAAYRAAPGRRAVIAQGAHRGNMVFVGLPLIYYAFGQEAVGQVAVLVGLMVVTYNTLAVLVLTIPHQRRDSDPLREALSTLLTILRNPLALGSGGGLLLSALGVTIPQALDRGLELVGRTALPLALIAVGAGLDLRKLRSEWAATLGVSVLKLGVYPALVWLALHRLGLEGTALQAPVILAATPTAVVSYVMAREMRGDDQLAAAIIIGTTLLSLPATIAWLLALGV